MRVKNGVEPINHTADTARGGSRPKPPKAVAQRASLEAPGAVSEHQTAKRRLTAKTVALDPGKRYSVNQDAVTQLIAWAGNMTTSGAQFQGQLNNS